MSKRIEYLKREWEERQEKLGLTKRAVLFKRFPGWLNFHIHNRHIGFILQNIPKDANQLLDVGCGYGRISGEIKRAYPDLSCSGIDICSDFATAYEREIGPCYNGSIQDFLPDRTYDTMIIVTLLMYLEPAEHLPVLQKLWSHLNPEGVMICIEPAVEIQELWSRLTRTQSASPTGGRVYHFEKKELHDLLRGLEGSHLQDTISVSLVPWMQSTSLHHGLAVSKTGMLSHHPE